MRPKQNDGMFYRESARFYGQHWQRTGSKESLSMFVWCMKRSWRLRGVR